MNNLTYSIYLYLIMDFYKDINIYIGIYSFNYLNNIKNMDICEFILLIENVFNLYFKNLINSILWRNFPILYINSL